MDPSVTCLCAQHDGGYCNQPATINAIGPPGSTTPVCDEHHAALYDQASDWFRFVALEGVA